MKPEVLDLRASDDPRDLVHRVVERLAQGGIVALPTETVYGVAASVLAPEAVERLVEIKGRDSAKPLALCVKGVDEARDWVPGISRLGLRLARRCWPGPVTLVFNETIADGLVQRLASSVRRWVYPADTLGLRVPAHEAVLDCQRLLRAPLVLSSANRSAAAAAVTAEDVCEAFGDQIDLVLDDGRCRYGQASSVVRVSGNGWQLLREGVVSAAAIDRMARCVILFVCTGNTCRSPMAEALCKQLLAERLGCTPDQLSAHHVEVQSAGVGAANGLPATAEAARAVHELGGDLRYHQSHYLTYEAVLQADLIFAMTEGHRRAILEMAPEVAGRVQLLRRDGGSVADPIGQDDAVYQACAAEIQQQLRHIVAELQL
jgi:protein-tyrosine phosphatase